jgi:hypothetical protein
MTTNDCNMENPLDIIAEWLVWGSLEKKKDLESILLKGHLLIEMIIDRVLSKNGVEKYEDFSFFRKIKLLETLEVVNNEKLRLVIPFLENINLLRNKLAHEVLFDINNGDFEKWSSDILDKFEGVKFSKYTYRTKIVHSFSILSRAILDINN